jgi:hypothetical protein
MHPSDLRNILDDAEIRKTKVSEGPLVFADVAELDAKVQKRYTCAKCGKKVTSFRGLSYHSLAMHKASIKSSDR